jgi:hypothetical protein
MLGNSSVAAELANSLKGLSSIKLASLDEQYKETKELIEKGFEARTGIRFHNRVHSKEYGVSC